MSTQLILYPQTYKGVYSFNSENEFIVDGMNFVTIDSSTSYSTATSIDNHLYATPPSIVNTWFRWINTSAGTPALPVETGGALVLNAVTPSSFSGVYQKLTSLTVGASYTLTVNMTAAAGLINLKAFNLTNNSVIAGQLLTSNTTQQTLTFVAETTTDTVAILYYNTAATNLTISSISLSPTNQSPTEIYTDLIDGQVICDLYQEEDIPLTLSIDDFKNVAEQVKSYSKDFSLPATKRNNRIFNNMFEVTRADDGLIFNPYVITKCVLKEDGFVLFEGYLRLIDVKDKEGEISYNVNLYSEVVALADVLKDVTFSDLDFTELEHDYNKTEIKRSWNESPDASITYINPSTSGFRETYDTLRYPFIDWTHQYIVGGTNPISTSATAGNPELTNLEQAFRPCIQLKYLINRIFAASGFNYTSSIFDSADFKKLYMDFNWGSDNVPIVFSSSGNLTRTSSQLLGTSYTTLDFEEYSATPLSANFGYSGGTFTAQEDGQTYNISFNIHFIASVGYSRTLDVEWLINGIPNTALYNQVVTDTGFYFTGSFSVILSAGETITCKAKSNSATALYLANALSTSGTYIPYITTTTTVDQTTNETLLATLRGELGQWDFLKGIMTMFNLVSMVDENDPDNILIEPYSDVFVTNSNSKRLDWTEKIDASEMELTPLTDLNKNTIFKFVEDEDDYAFINYKNSTSGHLYGSKEIDASGFTILEGTKEIIAEPFAATVSKPLDDQLPQFITPAIYSMTDDGTSEGFENSPRILYNNGIKDTGTSYYIPEQNGAASENQTDFLQFSHLSSLPPGAISSTRSDFVFESQQLFQPIGTAPTDNLYNTYWSPYFNELYNADTRTMTLKVNLSPSDVASFKFYDTVFIKNRVFRVNKIEYKPNDLATVEFILIP